MYVCIYCMYVYCLDHLEHFASTLATRICSTSINLPPPSHLEEFLNITLQHCTASLLSATISLSKTSTLSTHTACLPTYLPSSAEVTAINLNSEGHNVRNMGKHFKSCINSVTMATPSEVKEGKIKRQAIKIEHKRHNNNNNNNYNPISHAHQCQVY